MNGGPLCLVMIGCLLVYVSNTSEAATFFCRHRYLQYSVPILPEFTSLIDIFFFPYTHPLRLCALPSSL